MSTRKAVCVGISVLWIAFLASAEVARETSPGLYVRCSSDYMELIIDRWIYHFLDPQTFHFNGTTARHCKAYYVNSTHVFMRTPLSGCKTRFNQYADLFTFYNGVDTDVFNSGSPISRYPTYLFLFECAYFPISKVTLNAFSTVGKIIRGPTVRRGNFSFTMDMFQTSKYFSPYTGFPVRVRVGERVFLQIRVQTNASDLVLFLDRCKATPTKNANDKRHYYVLKNGCPTDNTLNYKFTKGIKQRFSFQAFRFRFEKDSSEVFLHCEVIVCHKQNNASRCNQACTKPRYLTKRDITTREFDTHPVLGNLTDLFNDTGKSYDVSLGPFKVYLDLEKSRPRVRESARRSSGCLSTQSAVVLVLLSCLLSWCLATRS